MRRSFHSSPRRGPAGFDALESFLTGASPFTNPVLRHGVHRTAGASPDFAPDPQAPSVQPLTPVSENQEPSSRCVTLCVTQASQAPNLAGVFASRRLTIAHSPGASAMHRDSAL